MARLVAKRMASRAARMSGAFNGCHRRPDPGRACACAALDHARRFAAAGWTACVADSIPCRLSGMSRAVAGHLPFAAASVRLARVRDGVGRVITADKIDLDLPTCEEVAYLGRLRERLPSGCNVFVAPLEQLRQLHSKLRFLELASGWGVVSPSGLLLTTECGAGVGQR